MHFELDSANWFDLKNVLLFFNILQKKTGI